MFKVILAKKIDNSKIFYTLIDTRDNTVVGRVIVNFTNRKSYWSYWTKDGRKIRKTTLKKLMSRCVNDYLREVSESAHR